MCDRDGKSMDVTFAIQLIRKIEIVTKTTCTHEADREGEQRSMQG